MSLLYSSRVGEDALSFPFPDVAMLVPALRFEPVDFELQPKSPLPKGEAPLPPVETEARRSRKGSRASVAALDTDIDDAELTDRELATDAALSAREAGAGVVAVVTEWAVGIRAGVVTVATGIREAGAGVAAGRNRMGLPRVAVWRWMRKSCQCGCTCTEGWGKLSVFAQCCGRIGARRVVGNRVGSGFRGCRQSGRGC